VPSPSKIAVISFEDVGSCVRDLRLKKGITQVELARMLGTAQAAISAIEHGQRGLSVQQVVKVARVLGATPNDILGENGASRRAVAGSPKIMRRVRRLQRLPVAQQRAVLKLLDGIIEAHNQPGA